jgi:3-hydroxyisobutyrate dehydrogenase
MNDQVNDNSSIGFIGLGQMGAPMVRSLLKGGRKVCVFDINPQALSEAVSHGAIAAESVAALTVQSTLIVTMLPSPAHVRAAFLDDDGILAHAAKGNVVVDCSTVDPETVKHLYDAARLRGIDMADAPVSGGVLGAAAATLTLLVGAAPGLFERIRSALAPVGSEFIRCGGPGAGQVVKISNNLLAAISMVATSEAMTLGVKLGADPVLLANAINHSTGRCWASEHYNPWPGVCPDAPASHDYVGGASTEILIKDLSLALGEAKGITMPLFLGAIAQQVYQLSAAHGNEKRDFASVVDLYR